MRFPTIPSFIMRSSILVSILLVLATFGTAPSAAQHENEDHSAATVHEQEHHGREWNLPQLGGMTVNFLVWLFGVAYLAKKFDVKGSLATRKTAVVDGIAEAAAVKAAAQAKYDEYQVRMNNMDRELDQIRIDMRAAGVAEKERIIQEAGMRADKMRQEARFLIEQRVKQLKEELTRESVTLAMAEAERAIRESGTDQDRLVQSYISNLASTARSPNTTSLSAAKEVSP